jgi:hypothetical protein
MTLLTTLFVFYGGLTVYGCKRYFRQQKDLKKIINLRINRSNDADILKLINSPIHQSKVR